MFFDEIDAYLDYLDYLELSETNEYNMDMTREDNSRIFPPFFKNPMQGPKGPQQGPPQGPPPGGGFGGKKGYGPPQGPPPQQQPKESKQQFGVKAVDPGAIRPCKNRYVYIWLTNGRSFWAWLNYVGRYSVAGWRWNGYRWVYFGVDTRRIRSFSCY